MKERCRGGTLPWRNGAADRSRDRHSTSGTRASRVARGRGACRPQRVCVPSRQDGRRPSLQVATWRPVGAGPRRDGQSDAAVDVGTHAPLPAALAAVLLTTATPLPAASAAPESGDCSGSRRTPGARPVLPQPGSRSSATATSGHAASGPTGCETRSRGGLSLRAGVHQRRRAEHGWVRSYDIDDDTSTPRAHDPGNGAAPQPRRPSAPRRPSSVQALRTAWPWPSLLKYTNTSVPPAVHSRMRSAHQARSASL